MKADPFKQRYLLELQALDTTLAQLDHRQATLTEHAQLEALFGQLDEAKSALVRASTALDDVQRELRKADADVQVVRDRVARNQGRLDVGVGTAKDLQAVQHELESLGRRQATLEDEELEVMERAEGAENATAAAQKQVDDAGEQIETVTARRDDKVADIGHDRDKVAANRDGLVDQVGAELIALYEKIRARSGIGAAPLKARRCGGCNMELHNTDLSRIREAPSNEVLRCEECGRILVVTEESGL